MILKNTPILTKEGYWDDWDVMGMETDIYALSPVTGGFETGKVTVAKKTSYRTYTLLPYNAGKGHAQILKLPRPCGVQLYGGGVTYDLRLKDRVAVSHQDVGYNAEAWADGFVSASNAGSLATLLEGETGPYKQRLTEIAQTTQRSGDVGPKWEGSAAERASWIKGFLTQRGWPDTFITAHEGHFKFFLENLGLAGLVQTGKPAKEHRFLRNAFGRSSYSEHSVAYSRGQAFGGYRVADIAESQGDDVWCMNVSLKRFVTIGGVILVED